MDNLPGVDDLVLAIRTTTETDLDRVRAAVAVADALGARGDALVTHFVQAARTAGCSWSQIGAEMGVSKQAAQQAFVAPGRRRRFPRRPGGVPGEPVRPFERFGDGARAVVTLARQEARALGAPRIGTEHLLLGLLSHGEGIGALALDRFGIQAEAVRGRIEELGGPAARAAGRLPLSPRAKEVLALAVGEAHALHQPRLGTGHILLGILAEGQGLAARILVDLGADLPRVREAVLELLRQAGGPGPRGGPAD
jgi:hypothetical protein